MTVTVNRGGLDVRDASGALVMRWGGGTHPRNQSALHFYAKRRGGAWLAVAEQVAG